MKLCPYCANEIQDAAIKCQFCHSMLEAAPELVSPSAPPPPAPTQVTAGPAPGKPAKKGFNYRRLAAQIPYAGWLKFLLRAGLGYFVVAAIVCAVLMRLFGVAGNLAGGAAFAVLAPMMWWLGDAFRQFVMPSWYFGSGALDLAKKKLFWMVGPQTSLVLMAFGACAGVGLLTAMIPTPLDIFLLSRFFSAPVADHQTVSNNNPAEPAGAAPAANIEVTNAVAPTPPPPPPGQPGFSADGVSSGYIADLPPSEATLFEKYQTAVYTGAVTLPDTNGVDTALVGGFISKVRAAVQSGPNFGGRYALFTIQCGDGCFGGSVVDVASDQALSVPHMGRETPQMEIEFVKDSRLLRMRWAAERDEGGAVTECAHEDFVIGDDGFQSLGRTDQPGPCDS